MRNSWAVFLTWGCITSKFQGTFIFSRMRAGDALRAQCFSQRCLFIDQVLTAISLMLATWCRHHFSPPRLGGMAGPQLSPLGRAGACLAGTVVFEEAQQWHSQWGRSPQQPKPKTAAKEMHSSTPRWQGCITWFLFNFFRTDCCSSPKLTFCLQQVLQVPAGSGIACVWERCSYKLSGYFHTSDGVDSIWWGRSFHLVIILYILVFPFYFCMVVKLRSTVRRKEKPLGWL